MRKNKLLFAWIFTALTTGAALTACSSINNPFNPRAELRVMDVASNVTGRFVGIRQSLATENNLPVILYTYAEPTITLENRAGFPPVNFTRFSSRVTLADGTVLPLKEFPLTRGTSEGQNLILTLPIMSGDRDLQNVVYPGNNAPRVRDGQAEVILYGTDLNGNAIQLPINVPLAFESVVFPDTTTPPTAAPSATPSPNSSPNPGGQ